MISNSIYPQLLPWGILPLFLVFLSAAVLNLFYLYRENVFANKVFDEIDINNPPPSKDVIDGKILVIETRLKNIKKTESLIAIEMVLLVMLFTSIPHVHPLSGGVFSSIFTLIGIFSFFFLKVLSEIKIECAIKNKNISFVKYADIQACDVEFIRSADVARDYLRAVALSERELTNYEIDMLKGFAHKEQDKNRENSIIETIKKL